MAALLDMTGTPGLSALVHKKFNAQAAFRRGIDDCGSIWATQQKKILSRTAMVCQWYVKSEIVFKEAQT